MGYIQLLLVSMLFIILTGCSHVMSKAAVEGVDKSVTFADIKSNPEALAGKKVLIGGVIAENRSSGDVVQLEVMQLDLLENGIPDESSASLGRFLVVSGELLDPLIYRPGLLITIVGEIKGQKIQKLVGADYRYPIISAKEIRLFRASDATSGSSSNPYNSEFGDKRFMLRPPAGGTARSVMP